MIRYFVHGLAVSEQEALLAWKFSQTYRQAKFKDAIWPNAHGADPDGAAAAHMAEAGIRIEKDSTND